jgi:N-acetylmuramoyl-L-alanine amidase
MSFVPDSSVVAAVKASPNHGERKNGIAPDLIVLHYTGMATGEEALQRLCTRGSEVSAHYVVFEDGRIVQCVRESRRAWHAGESSWSGDTDVNSRSIGIEVVNPGHALGYPDFPLRQIAAVIALCRGIVVRRQIRADRVLAHSDVAPGRKQDPGEKFPWRLLHESGVGLWVKPVEITAATPGLALGDSGDSVSDLQAKLADYGYGVAVSGRYDEQTRDVVAAFQRHFQQDRVTGVADASMRTTLDLLLSARSYAVRSDTTARS